MDFNQYFCNEKILYLINSSSLDLFNLTKSQVLEMPAERYVTDLYSFYFGRLQAPYLDPFLQTRSWDVVVQFFMDPVYLPPLVTLHPNFVGQLKELINIPDPVKRNRVQVML